MDQTSEIREKLDLVSFIGETVTLKKAGRNFTGLCPFHQEKSPSFVVSPERNIWHCFGCQKGGDAFTFVMEYEHIEFPEALRVLAKRTGVELTSSSYDSSVASQKERLYKINAQAMEFYHFLLTKHAVGKKAREYLENRGVTEALMKTFMIGVAPSTGSPLTSYLLQKKKQSREDIDASGLANSRGSSLYDFFRGRIIFPLIDHRDNVVGFSGRLYDESQPAVGGKYINTRDTLVYHKRDHFFGINITKEAIRKENAVLLVEGEFDVISCYKNGISNVVAIKGTALTENQVNLLSRYAQRVTMCFDGDSAGQLATIRSLPLLEKKGLTTMVMLAPGGKDPDEALKTNPLAFKMSLKNETGVYEYLLTQALKDHDTATPEGKKAVSDLMIPLISLIQNEIVKEHHLRKLASGLDTTYESIVKEVEKIKKQESVPKSVVLHAEKEKKSREETLEEYLLALIVQSPAPKTALEVAVGIITNTMGKERAYQKILYHLLEHIQATPLFNTSQFGTTLPQELSFAYDTSLLLPLPVFSEEEKYFDEVRKVARQLKTMYIKNRMKEVTKLIHEKEGEGDTAGLTEYETEYSALLTQLSEPTGK